VIKSGVVRAVALLLVVTWVVPGCESQDQIHRSRVAGHYVSYALTASELYHAYAEDEAADAKYKGTVIQVTGMVEKINKDILKDPYVTLTDTEPGDGLIQCIFPGSERSHLVGIHKGQTISVTGLCDGLSRTCVRVKGCEIR
jgi:hypothetical protein